MIGYRGSGDLVGVLSLLSQLVIARIQVCRSRALRAVVSPGVVSVVRRCLAVAEDAE